jgi:hypothetical protein
MPSAVFVVSGGKFSLPYNIGKLNVGRIEGTGLENTHPINGRNRRMNRSPTAALQ